MPKGGKLSDRERTFVEKFLGPCAGNGTEAVLAAGYQQNRKAASVTSARLLARARIQAEIKRRLTKREEKTDITNAEIDMAVLALARGAEHDSVRLGAFKELNKCRGRHSIKVALEGRVTIEDAMSQVSERMRARAAKSAAR